MRVLLTWELGLNLGHLARLLPIARRLKEQGHLVLVAARDLQAAATVLGGAGIPFVQAPHLPRGIPLDHRAAGYADILLSQGWSERSALWGLVQAWLNVFMMFRPDKLILDYSPTVSLAAHIAGIPAIQVGNGFELPPIVDPLPPFPGFSWATAHSAAAAENTALSAANDVIKALRGPRLAALCELSDESLRIYVTFPDLDHYGRRANANYAGPILAGGRHKRVDWPDCQGPKVFASLRRDTANVNEILAALASLKAAVVCVAPDLTESQRQIIEKEHVRLSRAPVDLPRLGDADLCITYGAEGTMMAFLSRGVPQLIFPWHVEAYMSARRMIGAGVARTIETKSDVSVAADHAVAVLRDVGLRLTAREFADRNSRWMQGWVRRLDEILIYSNPRAPQNVAASGAQRRMGLDRINPAERRNQLA
jgi:UDP:flavonoid glycosyltransferase YjiC (YdhE family)